MAKSKGITNKILYSRVSYLYQAAAYLAQKASEPANAGTKQTGNAFDPALSASRHLLSEVRTVAQKSTLRISPVIKHTICKRCNTLLLEGTTCDVEIENKSKGGKKEWADVLVRTCKKCNLKKRIPVGAKRQKGRQLRKLAQRVQQTEEMVS